MSERFFLDTNIFVYSLDHSAPHKSELANELIARALETHKGVIGYQVVQEFFNAAFKRFSSRMTASEGHRYLAEVLQPLLAVHSSAMLYAEALRVYESGGLSWYDSLIVAAALQAKCDVLYSEDMQHGRKFGNLRIANPFV